MTITKVVNLKKMITNTITIINYLKINLSIKIMGSISSQDIREIEKTLLKNKYNNKYDNVYPIIIPLFLILTLLIYIFFIR